MLVKSYRCYFCAQCHAVCPFSTTRDASIHNFVMGTVTTTSILNGFFANMERTMGYGLKNPDSWWDHDIPLFGISTKFTEKRG
ncbi:reductive dehalogenase [Dehalococcoides mccartyi]|nr:reductive dehalogenase [Dehalococcoides mccartyi]AQU03922.1 reductive dehalogenase [Dehalococcoides mccartyi]